jgi:eukaryotic-like serine/threonine-protein kinase
MNALADRNLLFGILAVQLDFVNKDGLIGAMNAWLLDKTRSLGDILRDRGQLSAERLQLLAALVAEHLHQHGGDPRQSLAALPGGDAVRRGLAAVADPAVRASLGHVGTGRHDTQSTLDLPPSTTVRYAIVRHHARGGLGEVYVAEDTELHRPVALKEIQPEHADDPESRARFIVEAEITGGLEHPGVVPVYGLGTYADGRPFYAMRFVQGDNLQQAIKRFHAGPHRFDSLAFRQLLRRFVDVCNAAAYAHSRGVLHRDLKPGNVMLGKYGETLVVDWGLAKVIDPGGHTPDRSLAEAMLRPHSGGGSSATVMGRALGTPGYMSPEQAAGHVDRLGPATDVYSLGATLYELLAGRPPFGDIDLDSVQKGLFPAPRTACADVPRALEAVCLKAMALDPPARYRSALALAAEIEHWLADEPVTAWREPVTTRLRRWGRRHRALVAGAAALLVTAVAGLAVGLVAVERERARTALAQSDTQAAYARARGALDEMSSQVIDDWLAKQPSLTAEQRTFLERALGHYEWLAGRSGGDAETRLGVAAAHMRAGDIRRRLGQTAEAEAAFGRAIELDRQLADDFPGVAVHRLAQAKALRARGTVLQRTGRTTDADADYRQALAIQERFVADAPDQPEYRYELAGTLLDLGGLLRQVGQGADAEASYRRGIELLEQPADGTAPPATRHRLAQLNIHLGTFYYAGNRWADAERFHHRGVDLLDRLAEEYRGDSAAAVYLEDLASGLTQMGHDLGTMCLNRPPEAVAADRRAVEIRERLVRDFPAVPQNRHRLAGSLIGLGNHLHNIARSQEGDAQYGRAIDLLKKLSAEFPAEPEHPQLLGEAYFMLGLKATFANQPVASAKAFRQAIAVREELARAYPAVAAYASDLAWTRIHLGNALFQSRQPAEAVTEFKSAGESFERLFADHPTVPDYGRGRGESHHRLAITYRAQGRWPAAESEFVAALAVQRNLCAKFSAVETYREDLARSWTNFASFLEAQGRSAEVEAAVREAVAVRERMVADFPAGTPNRYELSLLLLRLSDRAKALDIANNLADAPIATPRVAYNAACVAARASAGRSVDPATADRCAARAVELLRRAWVLGYANVPHMQRDNDLAPLRKRADYAALLWDVADIPPR